MTKKTKWIIGTIVTLLGILSTIVLKLIPDKEVIVVPDGNAIVIEQRIIGGGGNGTTTITKGITITRTSN